LDGVTGWYKRNAQYVMIGIAFVPAFGGGIDSIDLGRQFFAAPAITQAITDSIAAAVASHTGDPDAGIEKVSSIIAAAQKQQQLRFSRWSPANGFDVSAFFGLVITAMPRRWARHSGSMSSRTSLM
jgi:hypothetical protein